MLRYFSSKTCPYCGCATSQVIDRKYFVTKLLKCNDCKLMFRYPKDVIHFNEKFYQDEYEEFGMTTNIPNDHTLELLKSSNFRGSEKDFSKSIKIIEILKGNNVKVVDYGCNWGYTSYQFRRANFIVQSYEISKKMASVGNSKLGLEIKIDINQIKPQNDIFFSSHVIEHLSDIREMFTVAKKLLAPDGLFIAFCPNGSSEYKNLPNSYFHYLWGMVHPNFIDAEFYKTVFKDFPYILCSNGTDRLDFLMDWDKNSQIEIDLSGDELLFICSMNKPLHKA
jgi:2-polyprenyl-3-methyl-5-hydroxy-6-metoxy-1,4-benzoquinol methylase